MLLRKRISAPFAIFEGWGTSRRRDLFLQILEEVRRKYRFIVVGYVVMPEHFHLLISEPEQGNPATVMQVLKQRFACKLLRGVRKSHPAAQGTLWDVMLESGQGNKGNMRGT